MSIVQAGRHRAHPRAPNGLERREGARRDGRQAWLDATRRCRASSRGGRPRLAAVPPVNSGGFKKKFKTNLSLAKEMVKKSLDYIKIMESCKFKDIMVSLKAADVNTTILANE